MSSRPPRTPVFDFTIPRGATRTVEATITKNGAPINLALLDTQLVFSARGNSNDPIIDKGYLAPGTASPHWPSASTTGIVTASPTSGVVLIEFVEADTVGETTDMLTYDLWCHDPSGDVTPVLRGSITVEDTIAVT